MILRTTILIICLSLIGRLEANDIMLFGHFYPYLKNRPCLNTVNQLLRQSSVQYFIDLGDEDKEWIDQNNKLFGTRYVFVPGNHDVKWLKKQHLLDAPVKLIQYKGWWLILINSSFDIYSINNGLDSLRLNYKGQNCLIFSHHRIWNDSLVSAQPFSHDKAFFANELNIDQFKIKAAFAGNSPTQYMVKNPYYVAWVDWWKDFPCYNIGSGHYYQKGITVSFIDLGLNDIKVSFKKEECSIDRPNQAKNNQVLNEESVSFYIIIGLGLISIVFILINTSLVYRE